MYKSGQPQLLSRASHCRIIIVPRSITIIYVSINLFKAFVEYYSGYRYSHCRLGISAHKSSTTQMDDGKFCVVLCSCHSHPLRHHSESHTRQLRTHPHALRRAFRCAAAAGALPRDADECVSLLPAGADALECPAAKVAPLGQNRLHDTHRLHPQRGN